MTHKPLATKRRPRRRAAVKQTRVRRARLLPAEHGHHGRGPDQVTCGWLPALGYDRTLQRLR